MKTDNFRNSAYVDLLANVDLQIICLVELSDLKYKSSSNFKSIGWKLRILEIPPKLLTFGLCWPFDLKNNRLLPDTMWWSFMKIGLKLWPGGDWQRDKQTDRQTDKATKSTDQYTWKIFDFASNKQTNKWKIVHRTKNLAETFDLDLDLDHYVCWRVFQ